MGKLKNLIGRIGLKVVRLAGYDDPDVLHRYRHYEDIIKGERESIARLDGSISYYKSVLEARNLNRNIVFVSHDAHPGGAQMLSISIIRQLTEVYKYNVHVIVKSWGGLLDEYAKFAKSTICLETDMKQDADLNSWLLQTGANKAMCNTVLTGDVLKSLSDMGFTCISMIHEMQNAIRELGCETELAHIVNYAKHIVLPSRYVRDSISKIYPLPKEKISIRPQGIYNVPIIRKSKAECKLEIAKRYNLPGDCFIVLNVGYAHHNKGDDLFAKCAVRVCSELDNCIFLWVGPISDTSTDTVNKIINGTAAEGKLIFAGMQTEVYPFYLASDVFLLTSREDSFPAVVMEAMSVSLPVLAFDGGGGYMDLIDSGDTGFLSLMENVEQLSDFVSMLLLDADLRTALGEQAQKRVKYISHFNSYVGKLLSLLDEKYEPVSVIIPNYNYAHYLKERIDSVLSQTYPVNEIIILDDVSTDDSLNIIKSYEERYPLRIRAVFNEKNSGNVFSQWERGLHEATGKYIWIAEADDSCDPEFLQSLMEVMTIDDEIVIGNTQSKIIDKDGNIAAENCLYYTDDVDTEIFKADHIADGHDVIKHRLAIKNTIFNVSSVVFRNSDNLLELIKEAKNYSVAGDLRFYIDILKEGGKLCFVAKSLNHHRVHSSSKTKELDAKKHYDEICECQQYVADLYFGGELPKAAKEYRKAVWRHLV